MALTKSTIVREIDASGDTILVFADGSSRLAQGFALVDDAGDHAVADSWYATSVSALENSVVLKASAGRLFELRVISTAAVLRYVQIYDLAAAPPSGNPVWRGVLPAQGMLSESFGLHGMAFSTGILVVISTNQLTYAAPGSAEALFCAGYK